MITRLAIATLALLLGSPGPPDDGFVPLFDGKTTEGWEPVGGKPGNWTVKDGLLLTKGEGGGWLSTTKTYGDFTLALEYRTYKGGNSGVFVRAPRTGDAAYTGMEIQLLDDHDTQYAGIKPAQFTGSVYGVIAAKRGSTRPAGEWNAMEITLEGPKVVVKLNGNVIVDGRLDEHPDEVKAHPGLLRRDGYIGLQSHSDEVAFRNIRIKAR